MRWPWPPGYAHTVALLSDGTVKTWGANDYGQLGDGTTTGRYTPVTVSGITNAVAVAAGEDHTVALLSDGTVKAWGDNWLRPAGRRDQTSSDTRRSR